MEKLSDALKNGHVAKLRDGRIVLVIRDNNWNECKLINEDICLSGGNYSENGICATDRYMDTSGNDIVAVYKMDLGSFETMRNRVQRCDGNESWCGAEKVWEMPKDIEIDFDTLLRAMDGSSLLEWLLTPNEIAERVNKMIENPNSNNNEHFIRELKNNIPALKDAESFYIEREPGDRW